MARSLTNQDISWFLDLNDKNQLNLDPPYQRRSVWSPKDKRFFVDTILNGYPAPPVFLHKTLDDNGRPTYHVVDGKQRIQTIIDFRDNKIRIPENFSDINLQKKRWSELDRSTREKFWNYVLIVEMLPDVNEAHIRNTFERINRNSRKLTPQELRHAKYDGWLVTTAEAEAEKQEWKDFGVVTTARTKRMADVQFISELFAVIIKKEIVGFDQDWLDALYAEYEDLDDVSLFVLDDFLEKTEKAKSFIKTMLEAQPGLQEFLRVQGHMYTLWGYIVLEADENISPPVFSEKYLQFLRAVTSSASVSDPTDASNYNEAVQSYSSNIRGASTDIGPRLARHKALIIAMRS